MTKQKDLKPGVLPVAALNVGRGEGGGVDGTVSCQGSADEVTRKCAGVTTWLPKRSRGSL